MILFFFLCKFSEKSIHFLFNPTDFLFQSTILMLYAYLTIIQLQSQMPHSDFHSLMHYNWIAYLLIIIHYNIICVRLSVPTIIIQYAIRTCIIVIINNAQTINIYIHPHSSTNDILPWWYQYFWWHTVNFQFFFSFFRNINLHKIQNKNPWSIIPHSWLQSTYILLLITTLTLQFNILIGFWIRKCNSLGFVNNYYCRPCKFSAIKFSAFLIQNL